MNQDRENTHTLEILEAIEARSDVTQRHLADRLGIALGLANSYLKRCVRKGLIKITQAPANRYLYYLTPHGFKEKSRLTAEYLSSSFEFYRKASDSMTAAMHLCQQNDNARVLLAGVSELAEIASLRAADFGISIVGTYDPQSKLDTYVGRPVWRRLTDTPPVDACIYTALYQSDALYRTAHQEFSNHLLVPTILQAIVATSDTTNHKQ